MGTKYTQEQVERIFAQQGCVLKDQYVHSHQKVTYICTCGQWSEITLMNFLQGNRCKTCGRQKTNTKRTLSQDFISLQFKKGNCELLGTYTGCDIPVKYRCSCGNISYIRYHDFMQGKRCKVCQTCKISKALSGSKNPQWKIDRESVQIKISVARKCHTLLRNCLIRVGLIKETNTFNMLGYTPTELLDYIQAHWNWCNIDPNNYHIDHILPIQAFIDHGIYDPRLICALDNLRPCAPSENISKHSWYKEEHFVTYCQQHNIVVIQREAQNG